MNNYKQVIHGDLGDHAFFNTVFFNFWAFYSGYQNFKIK